MGYIYLRIPKKNRCMKKFYSTCNGILFSFVNTSLQVTTVLQTIICSFILAFHLNAYSQNIPVKPTSPAVAKSSMIYILFDNGKFECSNSYKLKLDSFCNIWKDSVGFRMYLYGNTDSTGRKSFNDSLAMKRVSVVAEYMATKGIKLEWVKQNNYGEEKPKYANDSIHKHMNRRVDVIVKYGLGKPKAEPQQPIAKKTPKKQTQQAPMSVAVTEPEPVVATDTVIEIGEDMQIIASKSVMEALASSNSYIEGYKHEFTQLSGIKLLKDNQEQYAFPKQVTYRFKLKEEITKEALDTLWFYDVEKSGLVKRIEKKVKLEKKKDGYWLKFKTRSVYDFSFWARLRMGISPCLFVANHFLIESPGYKVKSIRIKIDENIIKEVNYKRSMYSETVQINNYIGTNSLIDNNYTWEELSTKELEISLVGKNGKEYKMFKTLMELKHDAKNMKPELYEPKFHIHKDGCGHCGLTGGRMYFIRLGGNSTALATKKVIPAKFIIEPKDLIDMSSQVAK